MPSLRDLRDRISSVKSTKKITSAMKMVAASKLRRAQAQAEAAQPYAKAMSDMMARVAGNVTITDESSKLLTGTGADNTHLLVVVTADRGLCGGFNSNLVREARRMTQNLIREGKDVKIICVGRKGHDLLKRNMHHHMWQEFLGVTAKKRLEYADANAIVEYVLAKFEDGEFDVCTVLYNEFRSVLTQKPAAMQLIPFKLPEGAANDNADDATMGGSDANVVTGAPYTFEPTEAEILEALLPRNLGIQMFRALLDSSAGEHASRMTAMDNATRNAGEMIDGLSLQYNRARQAAITTELIEIISGAEAL